MARLTLLLTVLLVGGCHTLRGEDWRSSQQRERDRAEDEAIAVAYDHAVTAGFGEAVRGAEVFAEYRPGRPGGSDPGMWVVTFFRGDAFGNVVNTWEAAVWPDPEAGGLEVRQAGPGGED